MPIETGSLKLGDAGIHRAHSGFKIINILIDQRIRTYLMANFFIRTKRGNEFGSRGHIDAVHIGKTHRGRGRGKVNFFSAGFTRHHDDFAAGGAAHDGIIHQQNIAPLEFLGDGIEFLAHRFTPRRLAGHDESAADIAVFNKAFAIRQIESCGQIHGRMTARIGNGNHGINGQVRHGAADFVGQKIAHARPRLINRNAIHDGVRPRQINKLEHAGRMHGVFRALPTNEIAAHINQNRFARLDIPQQLKAQRINRHAL